MKNNGGGIISATILITGTTIDDAIWLVPYTTSSHLPTHTKIVHGTTFVLTLELLSMGCIVLSEAIESCVVAIGSALFGVVWDAGGAQARFVVECMGAVLCWSIAIFLYAKKLLKKKRRKKKKEGQEERERLKKEQEEQQGEQEQLLSKMNSNVNHSQSSQQETTGRKSNSQSLGQDAMHSYTMLSMDTTNTSLNTSLSTSGAGAGRPLDHTNSSSLDPVVTPPQDSNTDADNTDIGFNDKDDDDDDDDDTNTIPTTPSIKAVIVFTTLGALDEISYFPALIMGNVFTPLDLCIGALLASVSILVVIALFLGRCRPLVEWLDSIPLYGIVGVFAIALTIGLFV